MSDSKEDLHGAAPDKSPLVLLLIDVMNDLQFPEAEGMMHQVMDMGRAIAGLRAWAGQAGVPVVYVNDNFGRWQSDFRRLIAHCRSDEMPGAPLACLLEPGPDDYFVLKPKHSGFYSTSLELLLRRLGARTLILTGLAGNICVLYTANDAYMRDYEVLVPQDCCASHTVEDNDYALRQMQQFLKADTRPWQQMELEQRRRKPPGNV